MAQQQLETLFEFPCSFPIKAMAAKEVNLDQIVQTALTEVGVKVSEATLETRESSKGNFISVTATFTAESKEQLDRLYQILSTHPEVKMVL
jgi:putative lipoic acid-binding regulatory protein